MVANAPRAHPEPQDFGKVVMALRDTTSPNSPHGALGQALRAWGIWVYRRVTSAKAESVGDISEEYQNYLEMRLLSMR